MHLIILILIEFIVVNLIWNSWSNSSIFDVKYLNSSIITSLIYLIIIPAAIYLSWGSNLIEWTLISGYPYVKRWLTLIVELGINLILYYELITNDFLW